MYAGIEGQPSADREVILDVEGHLVSEAVFLLFVSICRVSDHLPFVVFLLNGRVGLRNVGMVDIFTTELDDVPRSRGVVEVDLGGEVPDAGAVVELVLVEVFSVLAFLAGRVAHPHPVVGEGHGGVGEQPAVEDVVPPR